MTCNNYQLGRKHYYEGLPVSAMNNAKPEAAILWLSGWLDAQLEHKIIKRKANQCKNMNGTAQKFYRQSVAR